MFIPISRLKTESESVMNYKESTTILILSAQFTQIISFVLFFKPKIFQEIWWIGFAVVPIIITFFLDMYTCSQLKT